MIILFILGLLLGAVTVIFALQNVAIVTVSFFSWQFDGPLAPVLLLAVIAGILIALLTTLPESIINYFRYKKLQKENIRLQDELRKQKELTFFAKRDHASQEDIRRIEEGASTHEPIV